MSSNPSRRPSFYYSEAPRAVFTTFWISSQQLQSDDNSGLVRFLTTWSEQNKTLSLKRAHAKTLGSEKKVYCVPAISFQSSPVGILPLLLILLRVISLRELISCEEYLERLTRSSIWLSWWEVLLIVCPPGTGFWNASFIVPPRFSKKGKLSLVDITIVVSQLKAQIVDLGAFPWHDRRPSDVRIVSQPKYRTPRRERCILEG